MCFNVKITSSPQKPSRKLEPPQEVASPSPSDSPLTMTIGVWTPLGKASFTDEGVEANREACHLPEVTQQGGYRVKPGTSPRALLGPSFLRGPAFDTSTPLFPSPLPSSSWLHQLLPLSPILAPTPNPIRAPEGSETEWGEEEASPARRGHRKQCPEQPQPDPSLHSFSFLQDQRFMGLWSWS